MELRLFDFFIAIYEFETVMPVTKCVLQASKVLGIILLAFTVFWTPFFFINVISVLCPSCLRLWFGETDVATPVVWWGYVSSTANPIVYTLFSEAFRAAFRRILTCKPRGGSTVQRATSNPGAQPPLAAGVGSNSRQQQLTKARVRQTNSVSFAGRGSIV